MIKPEHSPINLLGRMLYQRQAPWEQRNKAIILIWSVGTGLFLGGICMAVILFQNRPH